MFSSNLKQFKNIRLALFLSLFSKLECRAVENNAFVKLLQGDADVNHGKFFIGKRLCVRAKFSKRPSFGH